MRLIFPRDFYIPKGATKIADKKTDAVCYFAPFHHRPSGKTRYHLVGFAGKASKPSINYTIRSPKELESTIAEFFANRKQRSDWRAEERKKRAEFAHNVQVGDIYRTCWGYDQTNVEFFEVVEVKGKHAILREIAQASEGGGPGGYRVVPQSGAYLEPRYDGDDRGRPIRRLIQEGRIKIDDVRTGWPWGKRDPITGTIIGASCHATDSMYGH